MLPGPGRRAALAAAALALLAAPAIPASGAAGAASRSLLLLPIASGTPGQEWSARALGWVLEENAGSLPGVRVVAGPARDAALRELSSREVIASDEFLAICRRAGADVAVLGGSRLADGRLALELRIFDIAAAKEALTFRGEQGQAEWFTLVGAAVRHLAAQAGLPLSERDEARLARPPASTLEAYAAYRSALLEEAAPARIEKLRAALALDGDYRDAALRLGVELFRQGDAAEALPVLELAARLGPDVAEARNNFGVALASSGRAADAQREFEQAVALEPGYAEARLNLARVLEERDSLAEAERQYAAVLAADASNDKARFGLASLYDRTSRPELAIKEFRVLSARRPDLAEVEFVRAGQEARKSREYARAEKYFQRAADINPQSAAAWAELGTNSYLAGEHARGVEFFRKALALEPGRAEYHYYLGLALDKARLGDEAVSAYRRSVELGGPPEARIGLARAALDAGDPGIAVEELNRLLAASPDHTEAKTLLAQATAEMEGRRRLLEGQSQFANQRLARLEQIVADVNRANGELEARLEAAAREKRLAEEQVARLREDFERRVAEAVAKAPAGTDAAGLSRLREELDAEREARRREAAEAQAALAVLRTQKEQVDRDFAEERERPQREVERLQAELAAAKAIARELGQGSGETAELKMRLAGLQADQARLATEHSQEREARRQEVVRAKADLAAEREARRAEAERIKGDLAAAAAARRERDERAAEAAELKGRLTAVEAAAARSERSLATERGKAEAALLAERERSEKALAAEREGRRAEVAKLTVELEAMRVKKQELDRLSGGLAQEQERAGQQQEARAKAEKTLAAEREGRRAEVGKLREELEAERVKKRDLERLARELAQERERAARLQAERAQAEQSLVAERETRQAQVGRLEDELAAERVRRQELDRLGRELAQERGLVAALKAELAAGTAKAEQALNEERERAAQQLAAAQQQAGMALAAEREGRRADVGQLKSELEAALGKAEADIRAERGRAESELAAGAAKAEKTLAAEREQAAAALASEREARLADSERLKAQLASAQAVGAASVLAFERRVADAAQTLAERDRELERLRASVSELALELGRLALRTQSWERARGYLEQAAAADPAKPDAWHGLGEAFFQLGQYEQSKQMYLKAKSIY